MSKYIDDVDFWLLLTEKVFHKETDEYRKARKCLEEIPAAEDVVKVTRCKDCKYYVYNDYVAAYNQIKVIEYCNKTGYYVKENDFCSYGVREDV